MKKLLSLILVGAVLATTVSFTGCSTATTKSTATTTPAEKEKEKDKK